MKRIAIIGAGLSGLTVAYRLGRAGFDVTVFDAASRTGGQLCTAHDGGWVVELGAEGFVARSEAVPQLAQDLGMLDAEPSALTQLLDQHATTSYRFENGHLLALAPGEAARALSFQVDPSARGAGIRTFVGGMQVLTDTLEHAVRAQGNLRLATPVHRIELGGADVRVDGESFDRLVVATSSVAAAHLLESSFGVLPLAAAPTLSSVTVSLGYVATQVRAALDGTGFVVGEPFEGFRACTFTTSKFAHRAPDGFVSLRVFFRPTGEDAGLSDEEWALRAHRVLGRVLPVDGSPTRSWVSRWSDALPVFAPAHTEAVAQVEEMLADHPVDLVGSAFHGSGIDAAVRSAERLSARLELGAS